MCDNIMTVDNADRLYFRKLTKLKSQTGIAGIWFKSIVNKIRAFPCITLNSVIFECICVLFFVVEAKTSLIKVFLRLSDCR